MANGATEGDDTLLGVETGVCTAVSSNVSKVATSGVQSHTETTRRNEKSRGKRCSIENCGKLCVGSKGLCVGHGGGKRCTFEGCDKSARASSGLCIGHGGGKRCKYEGCDKSQRSLTGFCKGHGGGTRCNYEGCDKSSAGPPGRCRAHGGGRRCKHSGCDKSSQGASGLCVAHGGGIRCTLDQCDKLAKGSNGLCSRHGGRKRCKDEGCLKFPQGGTPFCIGHGGGKRCSHEGCNKVVQGATSKCKDNSSCNPNPICSNPNPCTPKCSLHPDLALILTQMQEHCDGGNATSSTKRRRIDPLLSILYSCVLEACSHEGSPWLKEKVGGFRLAGKAAQCLMFSNPMLNLILSYRTIQAIAQA